MKIAQVIALAMIKLSEVADCYFKKDKYSNSLELYRKIEPLFDDVDERFTENPHELDEFDPKDKTDLDND